MLVWCGVVWCGVVWCGVVWCGVVWCGVMWCGCVWTRCFNTIPFSEWNQHGNDGNVVKTGTFMNKDLPVYIIPLGRGESVFDPFNRFSGSRFPGEH